MNDFALGTTQDAMQSLSAAGLSAPRFTFSPQTKIVGQNGIGMPVPMGPPTLKWAWDWMYLSQWNWLLAWTPNGASSTPLFVQSPQEEPNGDDLAFGLWQANLWRPTSRVSGGSRVNVEVKFTFLVVVSS